MQRKKIYITFGLLIAVVVAGCGISDSKVSSYIRKGTSAHQTQNSDTVNLSASGLVNYIYENRKSALNASDCPKLTSHDWGNLYSDLIDTYAPAEPIMKSIDACRHVMSILETTNYPLDRAARSAIEAGWLNGIVKSFDYSLKNPPKREHLTVEKCHELYDGLTQAQWAQEVTKGSNIPQATACYHTFYGVLGQSYIDLYNQGLYDGLQGLENLSEAQEDNGYHGGSSSQYLTEEQRHQRDLAEVESLTAKECEERFSGWSDYEMQMAQIEYIDKAYDVSLSEEEQWENQLYMSIIQHCRDLLF